MVLDVNAPGLPSHDAAFHTNRTRTLWVPAGEIGASSRWVALAGTPDFAQRNSLYGAIAYDQTAVESAQMLESLLIPDDFLSGLAVTLVWTNLGAGSGNVVWRAGISVGSDGVAFSALSTSDLTVSAPAQHVPKLSATGLAPSVAARSLVNLSCGRIASDGGDTLGNDAGFIGYLITYTADM